MDLENEVERIAEFFRIRSELSEFQEGKRDLKDVNISDEHLLRMISKRVAELCTQDKVFGMLMYICFSKKKSKLLINGLLLSAQGLEEELREEIKEEEEGEKAN
jgi:hypothetical protein